MAIKFRKRIKIAPGVKLNVTSKGVSSASIGRKGLTLNAGGKDGAKLTTGLPGTGLSATHKLSKGSVKNSSKDDESTSGIGFGKLLAFGFLGLVVYLIFFG